MRPVGASQSALRTPFNGILGREANVRVLRALSLTTSPLARAELLALTELTASGLPRILAHLEEWGVIEYVGVGRGRRVQLRSNHRIARALRVLFEEEARRADDLVQWLRNAVALLDPTPRSAWIEGPVAERRDRLHDPVVVGVLTEADAVDTAWRGLRAQLTQAQTVFDAIIELRVTTQADLMASEHSDLARLETVIPLSGPRPLDLLGIGVSSAPTPSLRGDHRSIEARSLRLSTLIANYLQHDHEVVPTALRWLDGRIPMAAASERRTLEEWHDILSTYSAPQLRAFLTSTSERSVRLRQSQPFTSALPDAVRERIAHEADGRA